MGSGDSLFSLVWKPLQGQIMAMMMKTVPREWYSAGPAVQCVCYHSCPAAPPPPPPTATKVQNQDDNSALSAESANTRSAIRLGHNGLMRGVCTWGTTLLSVWVEAHFRAANFIGGICKFCAIGASNLVIGGESAFKLRKGAVAIIYLLRR